LRTAAVPSEKARHQEVENGDARTNGSPDRNEQARKQSSEVEVKLLKYVIRLELSG